MPIIDYKCKKCDTVYSLLIPKEPIPSRCPKCNGKIDKVISKGSFVIDGIVY